MADRRIVVRAEWDSEAKVYVAESEDVPGLITEAATAEQLVAKLRLMVPELLELNGLDEANSEYLSLEIIYTTIETVRVHA
jgi:predicted RNase H-like HicB family nuclease